MAVTFIDIVLATKGKFQINLENYLLYIVCYAIFALLNINQFDVTAFFLNRKSYLSQIWIKLIILKTT